MNETLLSEIGGRDAVEGVVALFYERVLADPSLSQFFRGVSMSRLHQLQVDFFCTALGGEPLYRGRGMAEAHAGLKIRDRDFDAVAAHLANALKEAGVRKSAIERILAKVAPLRGEIVSVPK